MHSKNCKCGKINFSIDKFNSMIPYLSAFHDLLKTMKEQLSISDLKIILMFTLFTLDMFGEEHEIDLLRSYCENIEKISDLSKELKENDVIHKGPLH